MTLNGIKCQCSFLSKSEVEKPKNIEIIIKTQERATQNKFNDCHEINLS